jgi:outer membrane protein assembly factor BamB
MSRFTSTSCTKTVRAFPLLFFFPRVTWLKYFRYDPDVLAITGHSGSKLHLFSATTGHVKWSAAQHTPDQPPAGGADAVFLRSDMTPDKFDVVSLANGKTLRRIDGRTGEVKWTWVAESSILPSVLSCLLADQSDLTWAITTGLEPN